MSPFSVFSPSAHRVRSHNPAPLPVPISTRQGLVKGLAVTAVAALLGALGVSAGLAAPVQAATTPCSDEKVTVMVEGFPTACANPGGNGYDTLRAAGFSVTVTQKQPDFICRINGTPDASVDKCLTASPVDAYWSYWHAPLGGDSWEYSTLGAFAYYPQAGSVEAWTWGAGEAPGTIPTSRASLSAADGTDYGITDDFGLSNIDPALLADDGQAATPDARTTGASLTPTPETNPTNPDEVIVYLDADGKQITKEEYEALTRGAVVQVSGSAQPSETSATTTSVSPSESEKPQSTRVMQAPAGTDATAQNLAATAVGTAAPDDDSQKWMIGMTIAFIALTAAATTATWAVRRQDSETQG